MFEIRPSEEQVNREEYLKGYILMIQRIYRRIQAEKDITLDEKSNLMIESNHKGHYQPNPP
ncbi:MAG: hypothetical protein JNL75_05985 [Chitinophagales bacterium]|nr:hypothetical protein [Chitinophagales bacterium]